MNFLKSIVVAAAMLALPSIMSAQSRVTVERNPGASATTAFAFRNVPPPAPDDAGSRAKLALVDGVIDPGSGDLAALIDGSKPGDEDDPGANFFFSASTWGGRVRMDLGSVIDIAQVNTYSWHPGSRGPQLYKLYVSDGSDPAFNPAPKRGVDPVTCGWRFVATVNTIPDRGSDGGQYGVSVDGIGSYRYLLFDVWVTEANDNWGNTFYSEIDVIEKKRAAKN